MVIFFVCCASGLSEEGLNHQVNSFVRIWCTPPSVTVLVLYSSFLLSAVRSLYPSTLRLNKIPTEPFSNLISRSEPLPSFQRATTRDGARNECRHLLTIPKEVSVITALPGSSARTLA